MDYQPQRELYPGGLPPASPPDWGGQVTIGNEADVGQTRFDAGPRLDEERFGPTEDIGNEYGDSEDRAGAEPYEATDDTPAPDAPAGANDGGDIPPEVPLIEATGEGEPNRGEALRTLVGFVHGANSTVEQRIHDEVLNRHSDDEIQGFMADRGLATREQAINMLGNRLIPTGTQGETTSILMDVIADEIGQAEATYGSEMEAAGVKVTSPFFDDIRLGLTDPGAYTEAVGQMPAPESAEEQAAFNEGAELLIFEAIDTTSKVIIAEDSDIARAAMRWSATAAGGLSSAPSEGHDLAVGLVENAETLAVNLATKGAPPSVVDPVRQLGIAQTEGLTVEWAVGATLEIIGKGDTLIGVDRVPTAEDWEPIYGYVRYLTSRFPDAALTREVGDTLLADIQATLEAPHTDTQTLAILFNARNTLRNFFNL